jgi:hypothetical protein
MTRLWDVLWFLRYARLKGAELRLCALEEARGS